MKVYMSGPMFSAAEVEFNLRLAKRLRNEGFEVYCPNESEPANDKSRTDITASVIYAADIAELESSNVVLMQVSEDSGTNWEAGYFDCLAKHVNPDRYYGIVGIASDIRLQTPPDPLKAGVDNQAGHVNALVIGGLQQSLGVFLTVEEAICRLKGIWASREQQ